MGKRRLERMRMAIADAGDNADPHTSYLRLPQAVLTHSMTLFHTTSHTNLESIKQRGLRPLAGGAPKPLLGKPNSYPTDGVFLGNFATALRLSEEWGSADRHIILSCDVPKGITIYHDPCMPGESVIVASVPRNKIRVMTPTEVAVRSGLKASSNDLSTLFGGVATAMTDC